MSLTSSEHHLSHAFRLDDSAQAKPARRTKPDSMGVSRTWIAVLCLIPSTVFLQRPVKPRAPFANSPLRVSSILQTPDPGPATSEFGRAKITV
jgi:hypothetical protein